MSTPEENARSADPAVERTESTGESGPLIDADVEADVNAAVHDDDESKEAGKEVI